MPPDVIRRLRGFEVHDFLDASGITAIDDDHRPFRQAALPK
jgi:hypothetical protein